MVLIKRLSIYRAAWESWSSQSIGRRVFRAVITVGLFGGLVKIVTLIKELAIAGHFGIGDSLDIYFTAILMPGMLITIIANSMYVAFLPTYVQVVERDGKEAARRLLSSATLWSGALLGVLALLLGVTAPLFLPLLATGFSPAKIGETLNLLYLFLPWTVISGMQMLWTATINSTERFVLTTFVPVVTPMLIIGAIWFSSAFTPAGLVLATTAGATVEAAILYAALWTRGLKVQFGQFGFDANVRQVGAQLLPVIASSAIMSSNLLVDQFFVATLPAGSVATMNYGNRLVYFLMGFITATLGTAIFPYFSKLAVAEEWRALRSLLLRYVGAAFVVLVPMAILISVFSQQIVALMYERGAFTSEDTLLVAQVQGMIVLQAPFYIAAILCVRLIAAVRHNSVLTVAAILNLTVNIVADAILVRSMGIAGIALATVFVYAFSFLFTFSFCLWYLQRKLKNGAAAINEPGVTPAL